MTRTLLRSESILANSTDHLILVQSFLDLELELRIWYFVATLSRRRKVSSTSCIIAFTMQTLSSPALTSINRGCQFLHEGFLGNCKEWPIPVLEFETPEELLEQLGSNCGRASMLNRRPQWCLKLRIQTTWSSKSAQIDDVSENASAHV